MFAARLTCRSRFGQLGEYRRVQLRVITERGVYEMVGMANVMMWYAPGGTWNIGKRDELGQNRGWYQAVSKAISPEGITNWQVIPTTPQL
jgi:hypothetical protein